MRSLALILVFTGEATDGSYASRIAALWLPGSKREIFGAKELSLIMQVVMSSLTKRPDTVGEPISTPQSRGFYRGCFKA
jgi:hypothetical protein